MEIIRRKCGEFGLSHFQEVYNAEKWDLENVKRGKNAEIGLRNFQMRRFGLGNFCSTGDGLWKILKVSQPLGRISFLTHLYQNIFNP